MTGPMDWLLHPRILNHCNKLYLDKHHKQAAAEAMTQVEQAVKEKSGIKHMFGIPLMSHVFGEGRGIKLRVPLGEQMQKAAESYIKGTFAYYRNYAHHEGEKIDEIACLRVMIIASDLLDLVGASALSFAEIGGVQGLISKGIFPDARSLCEILEFLDGRALRSETCDGFYEALYARGHTEVQLRAVMDLGLAEYHCDRLADPKGQDDDIGIFDVTALGEATRNELAGSP